MINENSNQQLATESIPKLIFKLSIPAITAQVINALYNIVDRMYISRIPVDGTNALTGLGVTFPIIMIVSAFASLVGMGGAPIASISMGKKDNGRAERILGNCFTMLIALSALLTGLLLLIKEPLLWTFGASQDTFPFANDYLTVYLIGTIAVQMALGLNPFITAQGFATMSMMTVLVGAVSNIILDPIFIFAFGMGVKGAALATILSQALSAAWVLWFLLGKRTMLKIHRKNLHLIGENTGRILALGLSPFIMQSTESLIQICFNVSLRAYGNDLYVGAMVILTSVMQLTLMPLTGFTQGAQPIIGYNYGAKNYDRVKATIRIETICCCCFAAALWILCIFFPRIPCVIFSNNEELIALASQSMKIFFLGILLFGLQIAFQNSFIALGQAKISIMLALLRKIILLIPLTLILPRIANLGTTGVFLAEPISDVLAAVTTTVVFAVVSKKMFRTDTTQRTADQ